MNIKQEFTIPAADSNIRLDLAIAKLLPDYSRTQIQHWIESGEILVNGQIAKAKMKVKGGEAISLVGMLKTPPAYEAEAIPLTIIYEDEAFLIINKPVGLVVHPGAGNREHTLLNALLYHVPALKDLPRAGILHRLDKNTSGLLVVAKTAKALKNLSQQLKKRTLLRAYQAVVNGLFISGGTINAPLGRHPLKRTRMAIIDTGKPAITHYRLLEKFRAHTHLYIQLDTGRTHQIRVHMAHIHHPIVGDPVYGGRLQLAKNMNPLAIQALREFKRQALHAYALQFTHPITKETVRFETPLPDDMQQLITALKQDDVTSKSCK